MKAQLVLENIDFERGLDPKSAMGIGRVNLIKNIITKEAEKYGFELEREDEYVMHWGDEVGNLIQLEGLKLSPDKLVLFVMNTEDYDEHVYGADKILKYIDDGELDEVFFYEG